MALKVGDICPQCKSGLLTRTEVGVECDECSFGLTIAEQEEEFVKQRTQARTKNGVYKFKPAAVRIRIEEPDEGEEFLRGLILARQNNNSPLFPQLIDGINSLLEPYRAARLQAEMEARASAGMQ